MKSIAITRNELEKEVDRPDNNGTLQKQVVVIEYNYTSENTELYEYLEKYDIRNISGLFDNDTCKIKIRDHDYPFIRIESERTVFIIYSDVEYDIERKGLETILFLFFSDGFENHFTKRYSVWSEYSEGCIAFKYWGQSTFAIWQYNGELPQQKIGEV